MELVDKVIMVDKVLDLAVAEAAVVLVPLVKMDLEILVEVAVQALLM